MITSLSNPPGCEKRSRGQRQREPRHQVADPAVDRPIGQDRYFRVKQAVRMLEAGGIPAVTKYEVLERFVSPAGVVLIDS